jgi:hypothetical protein
VCGRGARARAPSARRSVPARPRRVRCCRRRLYRVRSPHPAAACAPLPFGHSRRQAAAPAASYQRYSINSARPAGLPSRCELRRQRRRRRAAGHHRPRKRARERAHRVHVHRHVHGRAAHAHAGGAVRRLGVQRRRAGLAARLRRLCARSGSPRAHAQHAHTSARTTRAYARTTRAYARMYARARMHARSHARALANAAPTHKHTIDRCCVSHFGYVSSECGGARRSCWSRSLASLRWRHSRPMRRCSPSCTRPAVRRTS